LLTSSTVRAPAWMQSRISSSVTATHMQTNIAVRSLHPTT
jgi:hypothetical protein